jgi:hypothetical protein
MEAEDSSYSSGESGIASSDVEGEEEEEENEQEEEERTVSSTKTFLCFDRSQSVARQKEVLVQASDVLGIRCRSVCRALLRLHSWRIQEAATAAVVAPKEVCALLKIPTLDAKGGELVVKSRSASCEICFDDAELLGLDSCDSNHSFCRPWFELFVGFPFFHR